jgi:hypothetical protein
MSRPSEEYAAATRWDCWDDVGLAERSKCSKGKVKNGGADKAIVLCGTEETHSRTAGSREVYLATMVGMAGMAGVAGIELAGCTHPRERR